MSDTEEAALFQKDGLTVTRDLLRMPDQTIRIRDITSLSVEGTVGQNAWRGCISIPAALALVGLAAGFSTILAMIVLLGVIVLAVLFFIQAMASAGLHRLVVCTGATKQDDVFTSRNVAEVEQVKAIIERQMTAAT